MAEYLVYVTFAGGATSDAVSAADKTSPINTVKAYDHTGAYQGDVIPASGYSELRGMALDDQQRLYVANASKTASAIDVFGPPGQGVQREPLGTLIGADQPALLHPYGLAIDAATLYVSSQDTNVVAAWTIGGTAKKPTATACAVASYLTQTFGGPFFPGTIVASSVPQPNGGITPVPVPTDQGGLSIQTQPARHSVRGILADGGALIVADEAGARVAVYDDATGAMTTTITKIPDELITSTILNPVGVALSPEGSIAIGSTGHDVIFVYDPATVGLRVLYDAGGSGITKISGLAYTPKGSLLFGSRKNRMIYKLDHATGTVAPLTPPLDDEPECLLVVPAT